MSEFENLGESDIQKYVKRYDELLDLKKNDELRNESEKWYCNTREDLPQTPNYSKYNLLDSIKKGDVIYEDKGVYGLTGHIAIVEGIFEKNGIKYIRLIEANKHGVCRGVLDDTRVDEKEVTIIRPFEGQDEAVAFCISQLGKDYAIDFAHDTSPDEKDWYCSELVGAAYLSAKKPQTLELKKSNSSFVDIPALAPRDILHGALSGQADIKIIIRKNLVKLNGAQRSINWQEVPGMDYYEVERTIKYNGIFMERSRINSLGLGNWLGLNGEPNREFAIRRAFFRPLPLIDVMPGAQMSYEVKGCYPIINEVSRKPEDYYTKSESVDLVLPTGVKEGVKNIRAEIIKDIPLDSNEWREYTQKITWDKDKRAICYVAFIPLGDSDYFSAVRIIDKDSVSFEWSTPYQLGQEQTSKIAIRPMYDNGCGELTEAPQIPISKKAMDIH